jgi:hypothetical protein
MGDSEDKDMGVRERFGYGTKNGGRCCGLVDLVLRN